MTKVDEEWKGLKEVTVEAAEHTVGYQPKPDNNSLIKNAKQL